MLDHAVTKGAKTAFAFAAALFALAANADRAPHIGVQAGLLGLGVSAGLDVSEKFAVRAQLHSFDYSYDRAEAGNDYTGDLALSSTALLADWHPGGPFRLTAGLVFNNNELAVDASSTSLELGGGRYDGDLHVRLTFEQMAPYAGIGWSTRRDKQGIGVNVDLGVLFQGTPEVTADGEARAPGIGACGLSVAADGTATLTGSVCNEAFADLRSDVMREHSELTDALENLEVYPVAAIGLVYRF